MVAVPTMHTWATGEIVTAANLNQDTVTAITTVCGVVPLMQSGQVSILATTGASGSIGSYYRGSATITFATPFGAAPVVITSGNSGIPGEVIEVSPSSVSTTGFTMNIARGDNTTSTICYWIAIEHTQ